MNITRVGASKKSQSILDYADKLIEYWHRKQKLEKITLTNKDYDDLYKSATKNLIKKPEDIYYKGILLTR